MKTSNEVSNIFAAQIAMQGKLQTIGKGGNAKVKTKTGGEYSYKYVSFDDLVEYLRPILKEHGLGFIQTATSQDNKIGVTTRLIHTTGEWVEGEIFVNLVGLMGMNDYQVAGSAITYLKRYGLSAIVGIASDEDSDVIGEQVKPQQKAPTPSKASDSDVAKAMNDFKEKLEEYNIDPRKFLERDGVDMKDPKQVYATVRKYLGLAPDMFQSVLEEWEA